MLALYGTYRRAPASRVKRLATVDVARTVVHRQDENPCCVCVCRGEGLGWTSLSSLRGDGATPDDDYFVARAAATVPAAVAAAAPALVAAGTDAADEALHKTEKEIEAAFKDLALMVNILTMFRSLICKRTVDS